MPPHAILSSTHGDGSLNASIADSTARADSWFAGETLAQAYTAFVHLVCALLCFQQCDRIKATLVSE